LGESDCTINIVNSILWENGTSEINLVSGIVNLSYSDVMGGGNGTGNIDSDPLFTDPPNEDYHLSENSPCIDAIGGGGVAISSGNPELNECEIRNNSVEINMMDVTMGGGIFTMPHFGDATSATITNSIVSGNSAVYGGGLGFFEGSYNIERSLICNNISDEAAGLCLGDPSGLVENPDTLDVTINKCTFANNNGEFSDKC